MILNFIYWLFSPNKIRFNIETQYPSTIYSKQFYKITIRQPLSFYELDRFNLSKTIVNDKWLTLRAAYFDGNKLEIFLFNEGEFEFYINGGKVLGEAVFQKMNFSDWLKRNERN